MSDNKIVYSNQGIKILVDDQGNSNEVSVLKGVIDQENYEYLEVSGNVEFLNNINIGGDITAANIELLPSSTKRVLFNKIGKISSSVDLQWDYDTNQLSVGGSVWASTFYGYLDGLAATATSLQYLTQISSYGDVEWSANFDGLNNASGPAILTTTGVTAGTYNNSSTQITPFTVDAKGRITGTGTSVTITPSFSSIINKPTTLSGYGITDPVVTAAGSGGQIQFHDGQSPAGLAASNDLSWDDTNKIFTVSSTNTNVTLRVVGNSTSNATLEAHGGITGTIQGTGVLYVGQDSGYGGGIFYSGDASPTYASNEGDRDRISFFRRQNGTNNVVFYYGNGSPDVTFLGTVNATSFMGSGSWLTNLKTYNIDSFASEVRSQFTAGTDISISNGQISFTGTPAISVAGSVGEIQFNNGSNALAASSNLYWDNTNSRLGINTNTPAAPLQFGTNAQTGFSQHSYYQIILHYNSTANNCYGLGIESGYMKFNTNGGYKFYVQGTEKASISSTGNITATGFIGDGSQLTGINTSNLSGINSVSNGGTGFSSFSNGQFLVGNSSGTLSKHTFIESSGIDITVGTSDTKIGVDSTVVRTSGAQSLSGIKSFQDLTNFYDGLEATDGYFSNGIETGGQSNLNNDGLYLYSAVFSNNYNGDGRGIIIKAGNMSSGFTRYLIRFQNHEGTYIGNITHTAGSITYGNFTGHHPIIIEDIETGEYEYGSILKIVRTITNLNDTRQPLYYCEKSRTEKDKACIGVFGGTSSDIDEDNNSVVLSLGDGHILVNSENGNIEIGDYICSSNSPGIGMKQQDDILRNYTVAKATEMVDWSLEENNIKLISCTYHCG